MFDESMSRKATAIVGAPVAVTVVGDLALSADGNVTWDLQADQWLIRINKNIDPSRADYVFLHEVGHIMTRTVAGKSAYLSGRKLYKNKSDSPPITYSAGEISAATWVHENAHKYLDGEHLAECIAWAERGLISSGLENITARMDNLNARLTEIERY